MADDDPSTRSTHHLPGERRRLSRRRLLQLAGVAGLGAIGTQRVAGASVSTANSRATPRAIGARAWAAQRAAAIDFPFTLGVASGDPTADGFVLWTRLAPDPQDPSAMPDTSVAVDYEIFADEALTQPVTQGSVSARPQNAHAVHIEVAGLEPDRWYWYRFMSSGYESTVGRTRTFPAADAVVDRLRFASVSCQHYESGYYTAYQHMLADDLDVVLHLGDYIYEDGISTDLPRQHNSDEVYSLTDYRNRHAHYRTDADLQAAHVAYPFVVTWDDHEIDNDYADDISQDDDDPAEFLARRAGAYRAFWEHMPLRASAAPFGADMRLYRNLAYGGLANLSMLDTRQYRWDQACDEGAQEVPCGDWDDPERTLTGDAQEAWLLDGLSASTSVWNVVGQQVFMAQRDYEAGDVKVISTDAWDGYPQNRARILGHVTEAGVQNFVVLTGDVHRHWASDLKADFDDQASATIGSELICTSVTSGGDGDDDSQEEVRAENPHIHYCTSRRGYIRHDVTPTQWQADFLTMQYVSSPDAPINVNASFTIQAGTPGLNPT